MSKTGTAGARARESRADLSARRRAEAIRRRRRELTVKAAVAVAIAVAVVVGLTQFGGGAGSGPSGASGPVSGPRYAVGAPGVGAPAPEFTLPAAQGGEVSLAALRGQPVLLYFQEGLGCQPCWDQLSALKKQGEAELAQLGISTVVSVTTDPVNAIRQKVSDEKITYPVLSDPDLAVSDQYNTNDYGMMGTSRNGHTFILVDRAGTIAWRADYGGKPDYTMFVPVDKFLAQLRAGLQNRPL